MTLKATGPNISQKRIVSEKEIIIELQKSYQVFVGLLFRKLKLCCDPSLFNLPNEATLMFSKETKDGNSLEFRCGATLTIIVPKSFLGDSFSTNDIDSFLDFFDVAINGESIPIEVWNSYKLFELKEVKKKTQEKTEHTLAKGKDRSLSGRLKRWDTNLLPANPVLGEATLPEVVQKFHSNNRKKLPEITIKKRVL